MRQQAGDANSQTVMDNLVSKLETANDCESYLKQVRQIFEIYGLGNGCLYNLGATDSPTEALWRLAPGNVLTVCSVLIKQNSHPAMRLGKNRQFPFNLFDFRNAFKEEPEVEALYAAFEENNMAHAYGLPVQTANGETFVFVVARPGASLETVELLTLQTICSNAVNRVEQFNLRPCDANRVCKLSSREREILISFARGSSFNEIFDSTGLSEVTNRLVVDNILAKFKAQNVSHAIVLALVEGEFELVDCTVPQ